MPKIYISIFLLMMNFSPFTSKPALAQSSKDVAEMLQQREQQTYNLKFDWNIQQDINRPAIEQHDYAILLRRVAAVAHKEAINEGLVDAASIQQYVDQEVNNFKQVNEAFTTQMSKTWRFESDGKLTAVGGENQNSPYYMGKFIEYYGQGYGISANLSGYDPRSNAKVQPKSTEVWSCFGDATRLRNTFSSLLLTPEDFAMLIGKSPLMMYNIQWKVISTTPEAWSFFGTVETGNNSPFTVNMTLSRAHGGAPSYIKVERLTGLGAKWHSEYKVLKYVQYSNNWFPSEVEYVYERPKFIRYKRKWMLQAIKSCKTVKIWLPNSSDLADYRLIGKNLTTDAMLNITKQQQLSLVTYQWKVVKHKLPTIAELKIIRSQLHPGENMPDPDQSGSVSPGLSTPAARSDLISLVLPFLGGALLIIGGVWMFKQHRAK